MEDKLVQKLEGKSIQQRGIKEAPENNTESSHSAHANGMNEWIEVGTDVMLHLWMSVQLQT